jgi:imidazolonepropionase-like amidohydrolase
MRICVTTCLITAALLAFPAAQAQQASIVTAYTGARLIDGTGAPPLDNAVLLVRDGRVAAVGAAAAVTIPGDAQRVDLAGRIVMPGLINAHGHAAENTEATLAKYARYGVTTVVSLGGENAQHVALRDAQQRPDLDHARLFVAGPVQEHQSAESALRGIAELKALDVDFVKARVDRGSMPQAAYSALIAEAHAQGLKVAAHMYTLEDTKGLVRAGVDVLAHSVRDQQVDAELLQLLAGSQICAIPTLTRDLSTYVYETTPDFFSDPFFQRDADPAAVAALNDPAAQRRMAANAQQGKDDLAMGQRNLKTLHETGVRIAMGTDSGSAARFAGYFEHVELQLMVEAGLQPMDVLVAATGNAASCMGLDDVGTLAAGKWADFIVLRDDPLEDVANTTTLDAVYVGGTLVPKS